MLSRTPWQAVALTLICVALLWARVGGAHLHLCFDGRETPTSLHLSDAAHHEEGHGGHHGTGELHSDIDVPLGEQPLTKPGKPVQDLPLLLLAAICMAFLTLPRERPAPRATPPRLASAILGRRPPLRGPPAARQEILRASTQAVSWA